MNNINQVPKPLETQSDLEYSFRRLTMNRVAEGRSRGISMAPLSRLVLANVIEDFVKTHTAWLDESLKGTPGRYAIAATYLKDIQPEVLGLLTIAALTQSAVISVDADGLTSVAVTLGTRVQHEFLAAEFERDHPELAKTILDDFKRRGLPADKRLEYLQAAAKRAEQPWTLWATSVRLHIGLRLIDTLRTVLPGAFEIFKRRHGQHYIDCIAPTNAFLEQLSELSEALAVMSAIKPPMVSPPIPWAAGRLSEGCHLTHHTPPYPMVTNVRRGLIRRMERMAEAGELDTPLAAINAVQGTAWAINGPVLDAVRYVFDREIHCGSLSSMTPQDPPPTEPRHATLPADHPEILALRAARAKAHDHNRKIIGGRVTALRAFALAERLRHHPAIYFPHHFDSRGRMYPVTTSLHPQGADHVRGLLRFAEGKPLTEEGLRWLAIHGANCWGADKLQLEDRVAWTQAALPRIRSVAEDPTGDLWWTHADNPAQFLAFCLEYANAEVGSLSYLPVALDATCSGLQHLSAMLRDEVGGHHVNLTDNPERQDVYRAVAEVATTDLEASREFLGRLWATHKLLDRGVAKHPVMVKPYSGTMLACLNMVEMEMDERRGNGLVLPVDDEDYSRFIALGAGAIWKAIPKVVSAADAAMGWVASVTYAAASSGAISRVSWVSPAGFPVEYRRMNTANRRIKTVFAGQAYRPSYTEELETLDARRMRQGVAPNLVHSLDAAHLMLTVQAALAEDITSFAVIHDSFGVHASDTARFSQIIREEFVRMYEDHDVLSEWASGVVPKLPPAVLEKLPPKPERGTLDIRGVLRNAFFFS